MSFSEEQIKINERLDFIERRLMTPTVSRKDIDFLKGIAVAIAFIGAGLLIGEIYLLNKVNKTYSIIEEYGNL